MRTAKLWPDLHELEEQAARVRMQMRERERILMDRANNARLAGDTSMWPLVPDVVLTNLQVRLDSYAHDIDAVKRHHLVFQEGKPKEWRCACGATGKALTAYRAIVDHAEHVIEAVWGVEAP